MRTCPECKGTGREAQACTVRPGGRRMSGDPEIVDICERCDGDGRIS